MLAHLRTHNLCVWNRVKSSVVVDVVSVVVSASSSTPCFRRDDYDDYFVHVSRVIAHARNILTPSHRNAHRTSSTSCPHRRSVIKNSQTLVDERQQQRSYTHIHTRTHLVAPARPEMRAVIGRLSLVAVGKCTRTSHNRCVCVCDVHSFLRTGFVPAYVQIRALQRCATTTRWPRWCRRRRRRRRQAPQFA